MSKPVISLSQESKQSKFFDCMFYQAQKTETRYLYTNDKANDRKLENFPLIMVDYCQDFENYGK